MQYSPETKKNKLDHGDTILQRVTKLYIIYIYITWAVKKSLTIRTVVIIMQ